MTLCVRCHQETVQSQMHISSQHETGMAKSYCAHFKSNIKPLNVVIFFSKECQGKANRAYNKVPRKKERERKIK